MIYSRLSAVGGRSLFLQLDTESKKSHFKHAPTQDPGKRFAERVLNRATPTVLALALLIWELAEKGCSLLLCFVYTCFLWPFRSRRDCFLPYILESCVDEGHLCRYLMMHITRHQHSNHHVGFSGKSFLHPHPPRQFRVPLNMKHLYFPHQLMHFLF